MMEYSPHAISLLLNASSLFGPDDDHSVSPSSRSNTRDDLEHFDKDDFHYFVQVTFLVEGSLFRVPRHPFEQESEVFRDMFRLPIPKDSVPDGCSDSRPLRLDGILKKDFRPLLRVMFPTHVLQEEIMSLAEWTSVLMLSAMWQMDRVRNIAVAKMSSLSAAVEEWTAVLELSTSHHFLDARELAIEQLLSQFRDYAAGADMVLLARKYNVRSWLIEGYQNLVHREEHFSDEDEERLGWKTVIKLFRVRERYRRGYNSSYDLINEEFQTELVGMGL